MKEKNEIYEENGNNLWIDEIKKLMKNFMVKFENIEGYPMEHLIGYQ